MNKFPLGRYVLTAVSTTHNQVLFRMVDSSGNHDLLFEGVEEINLPFSVSIKSIEVIGNIVSISHANGKGAIATKRLLYQKNNLLPNESSIPIDMEGGISNDEIAKIVKLGESGELNMLKSKIRSNDWRIIKDL